MNPGMKTGLALTGIGTAWAAASILLPVTLGSGIFIGLTGAKIAYMNRQKIKKGVKKLYNKIKTWQYHLAKSPENRENCKKYKRRFHH